MTTNSNTAKNSLPIAALRPRSLWDILDDTFDLYRRRFILLAGIVAVVYVPAYLVYIGLIANAMVKPGGGVENVENLGFSASFWGAFLISIPLLSIAHTIEAAVISCAVDDMLHDRTTDLKSVYARARKRFAPLFGASILVGLLTLVGTCALGIGAFYVTALYTFVPQAMLLEGRGTMDSLSRSRDLCRIGLATAMGVLALTGLMTYLLSGGIEGLFAASVYFIPGADESVRRTQQFVLRQAITAVITLLFAPLLSIATTLLYYDLRVRREGLDLIAQAEQIGYPLAEDPFGGVLDPKAARR